MRARRAAPPALATGPAAVLLPGLGLSGDYLLGLGAAIGARLPAYVVDLPGSGGAPGPRVPLRPAPLGAVVAEWLDARGLRDVVAVGNSYGSQVAVEVARRRPETVRHLVLGAPTPDATARSWWRHAARLARAGAQLPAPLLATVLRDYRRTGLRRLLAESRAALDEPIRDRLRDLDLPVLVVRGSRDPVVPQHWAAQVAGLAGARLAVVDGAGHAAPATVPAAFAALVVAFALGDPDRDAPPFR